MILSVEQDQALVKINNWLFNRTGKWYFKLGGYAGTGKTYLLQYLINNLDRGVIVAAPTGKACSVLKSKLESCDVITIHKLLYNPIEMVDEEIERLYELVQKYPSEMKYKIALNKLQKKSGYGVGFIKKEFPVVPGTLVIIDESSMVTEQMKKDLKDSGAKVLFVGDPGQLPAVQSKDWFHSDFDFILNTIHRQAEGSPIIQMSLSVRKGDMNLKKYQDKNCRIIPSNKISVNSLVKADQIITGMNKTRHTLNRVVRKKLGFTEATPMKGDKLICLKNDNLPTVNFINGVHCIALTDATSSMSFDNFKPSFNNDPEDMIIDLEYDGGEYRSIIFDPHDCLSHYTNETIKRKWSDLKGVRELDYGYAITVHKSQGSEWDKLIIIDDKMRVMDREFRKRWLYTAITRAKDKLILGYQ